MAPSSESGTGPSFSFLKHTYAGTKSALASLIRNLQKDISQKRFDYTFPSPLPLPAIVLTTTTGEVHSLWLPSISRSACVAEEAQLDFEITFRTWSSSALASCNGTDKQVSKLTTIDKPDPKRASHASIIGYTSPPITTQGVLVVVTGLDLRKDFPTLEQFTSTMRGSAHGKNQLSVTNNGETAFLPAGGSKPFKFGCGFISSLLPGSIETHRQAKPEQQREPRERKENGVGFLAAQVELIQREFERLQEIERRIRKDQWVREIEENPHIPAKA